MLLQLKQSDVELAIRNHVAGLGIQCAVESLAFTAGRGENGLTVDIKLGQADAPRSAPVVKLAETDPLVAEATTEADEADEAEEVPAEEVTGKSLFS